MLDENKWLAWYVGSSWLTNFGHGMVVTVVGPTQPYLASNVHVDIDTINLVWTFGFFGYMLGAIGTGFIFRKYCTTNPRKMAFLSTNMLLTGALMIVLPFADSFALLVFARCIQNICLGAFITADTSLVVYTMGPIKSRPFTFALHSLIGVGFLAATFLVTPFLPEDDGKLESREAVCNSAANVTTALSYEKSEAHNEPMWGVRKIAWPFIISGAWCMLFSCGYATLGCMPYKMPVYSESNEEEKAMTVKIHRWKPLLFMTFFYYVITCGIERIYQPMAFTYGLCGPLKLSPSDAVIIDKCYNGGFMAGRLSGIFISKMLKPRTMVVISLMACVGASILLVAVGGVSAIGVYSGTCILGYFISWQFGACYSWVAQKGDITGRVAPLFLIGCGTGGAAFPPISGYVFTSSWGPEGILQLTLIFCAIQSILYGVMWKCSRKRSGTTNEVEMRERNSIAEDKNY